MFLLHTNDKARDETEEMERDWRPRKQRWAGLGRQSHPYVYSTGKKGGMERLMEGKDGLVCSPSGR